MKFKKYKVKFKMTHEFFDSFLPSNTPCSDISKYMLKELNIQDCVECRILNDIWIFDFKCPMDAMAFKLRWT